MSLADQIVWALRTYLGEALNYTQKIFPESTAQNLVFTSGAVNNTWSDWTEITDTDANTLTDVVSGCPIRITGIYVEDSLDSDRYMIQIAYGTPKNIILNTRFKGMEADNNGSTSTLRQFLNNLSERIPAGESVYYRMMCSDGGEDAYVVIYYYECS